VGNKLLKAFMSGIRFLAVNKPITSTFKNLIKEFNYFIFINMDAHGRYSLKDYWVLFKNFLRKSWQIEKIIILLCSDV